VCSRHPGRPGCRISGSLGTYQATSNVSKPRCDCRIHQAKSAARLTHGCVISLAVTIVLALAPQPSSCSSGRLNTARNPSRESLTMQSLLRCASLPRQASIRCLDQIPASQQIEGFDQAVKTVRRVIQARLSVLPNELPSGPLVILYKPLLDPGLFRARGIRGQPIIYDVDIGPTAAIVTIRRTSGSTGSIAFDEYIDTRVRKLLVLPQLERGVYRSSHVVLVYHIYVH
jgi:hypothetical protein